MPSRRFSITRTHVGEMMRFALVGGSGVLVNLGVVILLNRLTPFDPESVFLPLLPTDFNIRWFHVFASLAFLVANLCNFELNRIWTFRAGARTERTRFLRFFTIGLAVLVVQLLLMTLLMHPYSPLELPTDVLDGTTGFRTRAYWAQLITVIAVTPLSFLLNRLWTFSRSRGAPDPARSTKARSRV
ncbi:GtrA family protein [Mobilicoccus caccae]|uniref:GtrA/DPMS transmembrane domain-containing protein n=1 Tax=Mobilicoccus caccae TaxID=1859295 RepID=A0ABQ6IWG9_9MICO|nr:GtrA family protein [Mobilicoccus caccae]GMA42282.1 hypothetical protein GCM10025883_43270 [Mobilicoccus caccae]